MERRTLVRGLIGLAIGIPVLVEAVTFFGLVERELFGAPEATPSGTPTPDRVGVGEELLPATAPAETVTEAEVRGGDTPWLFVLTVQVENALDVPYELRLGTLTLGNGDAVEGGATTGRIDPGGAGQVTAAWELPQGQTPAAVEAAGVAHRPEGPEETRETVPLAKVPVHGG